MRISFNAWTITVAVAVLLGEAAAHAAPAKQLIVVASPGSPGTTDEAQPAMDAFAAAVSAKAGVPLAVVYDPSENGGVARLEEAGIGIVSLPFFLAHEKELGLHARLVAVQKGRPALEHWSLVAQKGRVKGPGSLAGFTIVSNAAFAPRFVRGPALGGFGAIPANAKLVQSVAVLSALRRAANGDAVAVLLDGPQQAALASLPFASKLAVVAQSPALPAGLVVTVGDRVPAKEWSGIEAALLGLASDRAGSAGLAAFQMDRFAPLDDKALGVARKAYAGAP
jgi:hypothetical protein